MPLIWFSPRKNVVNDTYIVSKKSDSNYNDIGSYYRQLENYFINFFYNFEFFLIIYFNFFKILFHLKISKIRSNEIYGSNSLEKLKFDCDIVSILLEIKVFLLNLKVEEFFCFNISTIHFRNY